MAASKEGYKVHVVRAGQFKGAGVPGTEVTADQLADYQREINALNEQFLAGVARGREMSIDDIRKLATGQVWVGQEAVDCGLADGVGSFDQALGVARAASMKTLNKGKKMAAASYQDIVAACPGATPDFICDQLKAGATADAAVKGWMGHQQAQIEQAKKDADAKVALAQKEAAEKIKAAEDKARLAETGVRPLKDGKSEGGSEEGGGSSLEKFNEFVEAKVKLGMRRPKAVSAVSREHPQLHAAVVTEANANRKAS
jgi:ClpP class serine protease